MSRTTLKPDASIVSFIIAASFFMAFGFWTMEAYVDSLFIDNTTFLLRLFPADSHELWMRGLICVLIAVFGIYCGYLNWRIRSVQALNSDAAWLLERAISKTIRGQYPVCVACKKIRDQDGFWLPPERFITTRTDAVLSGSLCNDCRPPVDSVKTAD